jgi:hypothetical protein
MKRTLALATVIAAVAGLMGTSAISASAATGGGQPASTVGGTPIDSLPAPALTLVPSQSTGGAIPSAKPPVTSTFSFSNGNIATFNSKLTFLSRYEFELYSTNLADKNCDARSVLATVLSQTSIWAQGYLGGLPYFYKNSLGCFHSQSYGTYIFESSSPVQYVYIALWAGNLNGHSSIAYSYKHYNPKF